MSGREDGKNRENECMFDGDKKMGGKIERERRWKGGERVEKIE